MQLSARILTALAVLAFAVGVVAGAQHATNEVSAATGTIDAMNVGACTTTNADVLSISDCRIDVAGDAGDGNTKAFFEAEELTAAVEVSSDLLYATYAHDPKTAAEAPRGIITNGDLVKISIKDTGRDRRDPVLIAIQAHGGIKSNINQTDEGIDPLVFSTTNQLVNPYSYDDDDDASTDPVTEDGGSQKVVADALGQKPADVAGLVLESPINFQFSGGTATFTTSGTYTINFRGATSGDPYKPIAPKGVVKFFGRVSTDNATFDADGTESTDGKFADIGKYVKLDEDVISGENGTPAMVLNVSVPASGAVDLQVIYYQTSAVEDLVGGQTYCTDSSGNGVDTKGKCTGATDTEDNANDEPGDVLYSADEKKKNTALLVRASSDGNDADAELYLQETGLFDGIYEGYLRLTDADGDGSGTGATADNWGEATGDATDSTVDKAAVLGVGNGPVVISYRDSGGSNRSFEIQIDIDPPVINIDSPAHNSRSDDEKPSFIGSINDGDSGLAADTFQLYIDNIPTGRTGGAIYNVLTGLDAAVEDGVDGIDRRLEYKGYAATGSKFGVIPPGTWRAASERTATAPADYKLVEADNYKDGSPDGEFAEEEEIDFDETIKIDAFNDAINFQALVRDLAGNVGFSDSDVAKPRFINDLGEKEGKRTTPNVLGVFSNHVVWLDEVDPYIHASRTATGFYGLDDDKEPIRDRWSVMVVFDNNVNGALIDTETFSLEHDADTPIGIADFLVKDELVFLKLDEELASDARPTLSITEGRQVEDMAGNILSSTEHILKPDPNADRVTSFKVRDGILPVFTLALTNGSGTGSGDESASKLTNDAIDIAIESDEDINGAPKVAIVCSNIGWTEKDADGKIVDKKLKDFVDNRTGYDAPGTLETGLSCGGAALPDDFVVSTSLSRPGNNWVYAWRNPSADKSKLPDGELTIVVWKQDGGGFDHYKDSSGDPDTSNAVSQDNYGSQTAAFTLDTIFNSPLNKDGSGGEVQPAAGGDVDEPRPFVLLDFAGERTNVDVKKLTVDGVDVLSSLDDIGDNRFLYWPEALDFGTHKVEFDARDAADNKPTGKTSFEFKVTARDPFVMDLSAGWNAVSFPANPVDTALDAVFTNEAIDRVVGWNPMSAVGQWSIASRVDGVWVDPGITSTTANFGPLTDIVVRYGYWVHSSEFIKQSVDLQGPINRETGEKPHPVGIQTVPGWNFVGVVDQDGDQTEDNWGDVLEDSEDAKVTAKDYMPGFRRAYTWDAIANGYRVLEEADHVTIGSGIWVYFPSGTNVAP